ncbi:sirohydrochlorin chelatase [Altericista sp. CCNU0014]|uniref:sirohydrochlorin chelatase n=1 Tax=Altericista sp. CCNU0014 TaxID=3082949 RepID=UPI0038503CA8
MSEISAAYFLIAHGSRDPRSRQGLEACATLVRNNLAAHGTLKQPVPYVGTGVLEFGEQPLAVQIAAFAAAVARDGIRQVFLIPLFLVAGNHVNRDLPEAIHQARSDMPESISLQLCPFLGSHPSMAQLLQERMNELRCDRWILLAHGTKRPGGNPAIDALATQLGAASAYWATAPTLEARLRSFSGGTPLRVGILPYFLFTGSIIDSIGDRVAQLRAEYSELDLHLARPLNPSPLLATLLLDRCTRTSSVPQ